MFRADPPRPAGSYLPAVDVNAVVAWFALGGFELCTDGVRRRNQSDLRDFFIWNAKDLGGGLFPEGC